MNVANRQIASSLSLSVLCHQNSVFRSNNTPDIILFQIEVLCSLFFSSYTCLYGRDFGSFAFRSFQNYQISNLIDQTKNLPILFIV